MFARIVTCAFFLVVSGCFSQSNRSTTESTLGATCANTDGCSGGEFCDRGQCASVDTQQVFGHGYGAQCFPEDAYPPDGRDTHCRRWSCHEGHCSSCIDDSECTQGKRCLVQPGVDGKTCALEVLDLTQQPRMTQKGVIPEPVWAPATSNECEIAKDCAGDEFCDRGKCVAIAVDQHGHGYGGGCQLVAPFSPRGVCFQYLCVNQYCSSCVADSECDATYPHCIRSPYWPEGRVCDKYEESHYFDERGCLREEHWGTYTQRRDDLVSQIRWREQAGLPTRTLTPPAEQACLPSFSE